MSNPLERIILGDTYEAPIGSRVAFFHMLKHSSSAMTPEAQIPAPADPTPIQQAQKPQAIPDEQNTGASAPGQELMLDAQQARNEAEHYKQLAESSQQDAEQSAQLATQAQEESSQAQQQAQQAQVQTQQSQQEAQVSGEQAMMAQQQQLQARQENMALQQKHMDDRMTYDEHRRSILQMAMSNPIEEKAQQEAAAQAMGPTDEEGAAAAGAENPQAAAQGAVGASGQPPGGQPGQPGQNADNPATTGGQPGAAPAKKPASGSKSKKPAGQSSDKKETGTKKEISVKVSHDVRSRYIQVMSKEAGFGRAAKETGKGALFGAGMGALAGAIIDPQNREEGARDGMRMGALLGGAGMFASEVARGVFKDKGSGLAATLSGIGGVRVLHDMTEKRQKRRLEKRGEHVYGNINTYDRADRDQFNRKASKWKARNAGMAGAGIGAGIGAIHGAVLPPKHGRNALIGGAIGAGLGGIVGGTLPGSARKALKNSAKAQEDDHLGQMLAKDRAKTRYAKMRRSMKKESSMDPVTKDRLIGAGVGALTAAGLNRIGNMKTESGRSSSEHEHEQSLDLIKREGGPRGYLGKVRSGYHKSMLGAARTGREHPKSDAAVHALIGAGAGAVAGPTVNPWVRKHWQAFRAK